MIRNIKVSNKKPPQWILDGVKEAFDVDWESGAIFTYGDLITTHSGEIPEDYVVHEGNHTKQQEKIGGPDKWWKKYLEDPQFRLDQEIECYQKQYKWLKSKLVNRQVLFDRLNHYAYSMTNGMYGDIITWKDAVKLIKNE